MKPLSSGDTGVITADTAALAAADAATESVLAAAPADLPAGAILDVPLMQLPIEEDEVAEPAFALAQKITEDGPAAGGFPLGAPGMSGLGDGSVLPQDILSGISADASAALGGLEGAVTEAAEPLLAAAQTAFDQASSALTGGAGGGAASAAGAGTPAAAATTMTEDPVTALLNGVALPALPGIEALFQPLLDLLSSFGTGVIGALDPTAILSGSSAAIETAMGIAQGGMKTVQQVWEGQAADAATVAAQQAQVHGEETSERGIDIAALTQQAAAVVQSGNAQLFTIASTFAAQAVALAPTIMLPPTQTALVGLATQHLGQAVTVVNTTRGQLAGHTAELGGVVQQLAAQSGLPAPDQVLAAASQNLGEPLMSKAQSALTGGDGATTAASTGGGTSTLGSTTPSALGTGGSGGGGTGGGGGALGALGTARGGGGISTGGSGAPGAGAPKSAALPGAAMPAARAMGVPGMGSGFGGTSPAGAGGSGFMGGGGAGAGAGQRGNNDEEHGRTVQPYQSRTGNDDLTGPLGESTPDVIGAVHEDERESAEDRF